MKVYVIYDEKVGRAGTPLIFEDDVTATRMFQRLVNEDEYKYIYPDLTLYHIGEYDSKALTISCVPRVKIASGIEVFVNV